MLHLDSVKTIYPVVSYLFLLGFLHSVNGDKKNLVNLVNPVHTAGVSHSLPVFCELWAKRGGLCLLRLHKILLETLLLSHSTFVWSQIHIITFYLAVVV